MGDTGALVTLPSSTQDRPEHTPLGLDHLGLPHLDLPHLASHQPQSLASHQLS